MAVLNSISHGQVQVITAHGLIAAFKPGRGTEQGEISSPLLCKILYDSLLTRLKDLSNEFCMESTPIGKAKDLVSLGRRLAPIELPMTTPSVLSS